MGKALWFVMYCLVILGSSNVFALTPVSIYSENELLVLIQKNQHLNQIQQDNCQLLQDIQARADRVQSPIYQFLYGDMLAWGVCVPQDSKEGLKYLHSAAYQGLSEALEQLGRYYAKGILVTQNDKSALRFLKTAALMGDNKAIILWVQLLLEKRGSPIDFTSAYEALLQMQLKTNRETQEIDMLKQRLAQQMPKQIVYRLEKDFP